MLPSPSQLMSRSRMRLVRSASRGPTTDAARGGVEPHHIERRAGGDAQAAALTDGEMNDAVVVAEHAAIEIDDLARNRPPPGRSRSMMSA